MIPRHQFERRLAEFVKEKLLGGDPAISVHRDTLLFEEGVINSLRILDLIAFVEQALGIKIPDTAIKLANFRSIRTIAQTFLNDDPHKVEEVLQGDPHVAAERVFEHRAGRTRFTDPIEALQARGELMVLGPGQVGLSGTPLRLFRYFDSVARQWARDLGASEHRFPSLMPLGTLVRAGYPQAFPQHLTLASHVAEGVESLRRVAVDPWTLLPRDLSSPEHVLAPAVCYHWYPTWEGRTLKTQPVVITAQGRCFRYESTHLKPLERLWDFSMREIMVLGSAEEVEETRRDLVGKASRLMVELNLDGRIETARDPFFTRESPGRGLMQQLQSLKYELGLSVDGNGRTAAVASFNHHQDFFARCFEIRQASGAPAHSGCVAFGLERWVLAFLAQYGLDEAHWPQPVRAFVQSEENHRPA